VLVANVFRQDFIRLGYTTSLSYHFSHDQGDEAPHRSADEFPVRPAAFSSPSRHRIKTHYLGWAGDGHLGRTNVSHALYYVRGTDEDRATGRRFEAEQQVSAWFMGAEASVDRDWARFKLTGVFASGDDDAEDGRSSGFDSIHDRGNFAGGPFSYWVRSGLPLTQTAVQLKSRGSLLPDLRSDGLGGQANHVNPGLILAGLGLDLDLAPKLRAVVSANYLRFHRTGALERLLLQPGLRKDIGLDLGVGVLWRPLLNENMVIAAGLTGLVSGGGFDDLYSRSCSMPGCAAGERKLYNGFVQVKLTY
jgi:hypothetical protein